jgi:hypothetical protein
MYHYTYKFTQPETGLYYIGVRTSECKPKEDSYTGSMCHWKLSKEEKDNLIKEILFEYSSRDEAEFDESRLIEMYIKDPLNMNAYIPIKGFSFYGNSHTEDTRNKISNSNKNYYINGNINAFKGKNHSEETRKMISESLSGENHPFFGKTHNEETKQKMSKSQSGENNAMYGKRGELSPKFGKPVSEETRQKMSESKKGKKRGPYKKKINC